MTSWHPTVRTISFVLSAILGVAMPGQPSRVFSQDLARLLDEADQTEQSGTTQRNATNRAEPPRDGTGAEKGRLPVPSQTDQRASAAKIREIYGKDAASAGTAAQKTRLARQLLDQANADGKASDRYVLLDTASRLAIEAGDPGLLTECRSLMTSQFAINSAAIRKRDLDALAASAPVETLADVIQFILDASQADLAVGRFDSAEETAKMAGTAARRARNPALSKRATARLAEIRGMRKQEAELKPLLDRLAADANDRDAAKQLGIIRCFTQSRWAEGVPLLAKGDDPILAKISAMELQQGKDSIVAAADAWWEYAGTRKPGQKEVIRRHAADLYQSALPELTGLDKVKVEKRLQEAALATEGSERGISLVDIQEASVTGAKYGFSKDGTYMGKPFKCVNDKWPRAITMVPDGNATAAVQYELAAPASRIQGRVGVFTAADAKPDQQPGSPLVFEIVADGKVVWRSPPMMKRDTTQVFRADLRGVTSIELRTTATGSGYCAWGSWLEAQLVR